jgi:hypothetical protein
VLDDLRHPEALRFIAECEHRRVPILGFEWFRRDGETVIPVGSRLLDSTPRDDVGRGSTASG